MSATQKKPKKIYEYDCISAKQGKYDLLIFFAPAKEIVQFSSINQKEEDEDGGYQRAVSPARTKVISRYVDAGNPLPLSLLLTLEKKAVDTSDGKVRIISGKKSGWVIDGQHRLIGAYQASTDIYLPVVAFVGLSLEEQISQFVTVNKEAKGVPTSLYYSLLKKLPAKISSVEAAKERAANIGMSLKMDEDSPFFGRIVSTTSPKTGQISLVNFVRKIHSLIREDSGLLGSYSLEEQEKIVNNYYLAIGNVFGKKFEAPDSVFFQTIGFGAMFNFFPVAFNYVLKESQSFTVSDVTSALKNISHIDVEKWKKAGTGSAAELAIGKDIVAEFRELTEDKKSKGSSIIKL